MTYRSLCAGLAASTCIIAFVTPAVAQTRSFDIPASDLATALDSFARQSGAQILYKVDQIQGKRSKSVKGNVDTAVALRRLLSGSGFEIRQDRAGAIAIVPVGNGQNVATDTTALAADAGDIIVTAQKREARLLDVPISMSAVSGADCPSSGHLAQMVAQRRGDRASSGVDV